MLISAKNDCTEETWLASTLLPAAMSHKAAYTKVLSAEKRSSCNRKYLAQCNRLVVIKVVEAALQCARYGTRSHPIFPRNERFFTSWHWGRTTCSGDTCSWVHAPVFPGIHIQCKKDIAVPWLRSRVMVIWKAMDKFPTKSRSNALSPHHFIHQFSMYRQHGMCVNCSQKWPAIMSRGLFSCSIVMKALSSWRCSLILNCGQGSKKK